MRGNSFVPRQLQIAVGDAVEFVNGNGGPHNVAFWPDSLPAGARDPLAMALPDSIGPLIGPLFIDPDQRWTVTFAGVPPGRYPYYCLPHLVGGMVAELVVVRPGADR
jgi:plastocyanin